MTIDELLLPQTPERVAAAYRSLPERAAARGFGPLEEGIVVLDTETTGLSFKDCELIEISAALLIGREIVDRFETFVDPGRPIPPEITQLTGIANVDVAGAPKPKEAVAALAEFVGGAPVLAHNATFDRTFIEAVPHGADVSSTWIDTLALSRIALPRLKSHRLQDMAEAFGCAAVTHRSSDDVDALSGMWPILLTALTDLPQGLLAQLAGMHPEHEWAFRPVFGALAAEKDADSVPFSLKAWRAGFIGAAPAQAKVDAAELDGPVAPSADEVAAEFTPEGVVGRMYGADAMEARPEQVAMAREVTEALATSTHRAIEAGTGVGKSIAYLLPMALFAQKNGVTVGVATKTNALTDQLVAHELPALAAALPEGLTFASLKGYDHYPCLRRLDRAAEEAELPLDQVPADGRSAHAVAGDQLTAIAVTYAFAAQSPEGDLDALGIRWRYVPRSLLTTTPGECLRGRCPYFPNECLLHGARRRAASADVVVTNHSLLLRNVEADGRILPPIRHWVVDEAHGLEAEARRQWAREVAADEVRATFEQLGGVKTGAIHNVMTQAMGLDGSTLVVGLLTKAAADAARAQTAMAQVFEAVHGLEPLARGGEGYDLSTVWLGEEARETGEWAAVREAGEAAVDALEEAVKQLASASSALSAEAPQLAADLGDSTHALRDLLADLKLICSGADDAYVYSAQVARSKRRLGAEKLMAEKLDVGADLAERWLPEMHTVAFTSATIAVGEDFQHFDEAVGLAALGPGTHKDLRLDSSFDFDAHMGVVVAADLPAPNEREYLGALVDLLFDVHVAMGGSVLTLFTNRRDMEKAYEKLRPRLARAGLEVVCQERGASARRLRQRFVAERDLSLMALKSFWEGFDAAGETLRCVVIPKLPFANPNDPIVRERDRREDRSWWKHSLPDAVIEVKQAAGRLIRTSTDTGVLVLADSRVATKGYGKLFVSSLPSKSVARLEAANVGRYIEMWRSSHE